MAWALKLHEVKRYGMEMHKLTHCDGAEVRFIGRQEKYTIQGVDYPDHTIFQCSKCEMRLGIRLV